MQDKDQTEREFFNNNNITPELLIEITSLANFLDVSKLVDICCSTISNILNRHEVSSLDDIFSAVNKSSYCVTRYM